MKFTVAAATAIALAFAATTASAGVVITQDLSVKDQAGTRKFQRTVMVQGHKQKVITGDRVVITDLDAGKIYLLRTSARAFLEAPFPPEKIIASDLVREGLAVGFHKTAKTNKFNGYACQDYAGGSTAASVHVGVIECVSSDAPGAREFTEFRRLQADKLKHTQLAPDGETPDGIPVSSITKLTGAALAMTGGISPELLAKLQAQLDKKPITTYMGISKIEAKDLPAETFTVPADYSRKHDLPKSNMGAKLGPPPSPAPPPAKH